MTNISQILLRTFKEVGALLTMATIGAVTGATAAALTRYQGYGSVFAAACEGAIVGAASAVGAYATYRLLAQNDKENGLDEGDCLKRNILISVLLGGSAAAGAAYYFLAPLSHGSIFLGTTLAASTAPTAPFAHSMHRFFNPPRREP